MMRYKNRRSSESAELDITAFMNLMIVLVPVLLLGMVFSQITVLEINLPLSSAEPAEVTENKEIELLILDHQLIVNYPQGVLLKQIPDTPEGQRDFDYLTQVLKEIKRQLASSDVEKRNIILLSKPDTDYQTIISLMDTVRSYKAVVAASVVDAELFPDISFGDAPIADTYREES